MRMYCGIDLHARSSQVCVIDEAGEVQLNRKVPNRLEGIVSELEAFDAPVSVAVESTFNWYWLVDGLQDAGHDVHLGHPLKIAMITRAKVKTDRRDAHTLARLLRSGDFPEAYIYPRETRPVRDLVRHRGKLVTWRAREYGALRLRLYRHGILEHSRTTPRAVTEEELDRFFEDPRTRQILRLERARIRLLSSQIENLEALILAEASKEDGYQRLRSIPGLGKALAAVVFYESGQVDRFPSARHYSSYCRLIPGIAESMGKSKPGRGRKQGNPHLKSAYSQAAVHAIRYDERIRAFFDRHVGRRRGRSARPIARAIVAHKLGLAGFHVLREGVEYEHRLLFGN